MEPSDHKTPRRPFTLLDAMVLVAAVAAGLGAVRGWVELRSRLPQFDNGPFPARLQDVRDGYTAVRLVLVPVTLALIPLGLRAPRPPLGRLWSRPGMIVPVALVLAILSCAFDETGFPHLMGFHYLYASPAQRAFYVINEAISISRAPAAIVVAWTALALAGRWEPETSWVGWLGRGIGFAWIGGCLGYRGCEVIMYWAFGATVV